MAWRIAVEDMSDNVEIADLPFKQMTVTWTLNGPGVISVDLNPYGTPITYTNLHAGDKQLAVYHDGDLCWGGYLQTHRVSVAQNKDHQLTMIGEGYYSMLRQRIVTSDLIYEDVPIQQIMWNLIDHSQDKTGGNISLTQGLHNGSDIEIDREYCALEYPNVAQSIDELSTMDDGCDWVITPTISSATRKIFRTFQPRRGTDLSGSVILGQNKVSRLTYEINSVPITNYVYNVGLDDCNPPVYEAIDTSSRTQYKLRESVQDVESGRKRDLRRHGEAILRNYKNPVFTAEATFWEGNGPAFGAFDIGDTIQVTSSVGFASFVKTMRVMAISIAVQPPEIDFWTVTLDEVID